MTARHKKPKELTPMQKNALKVGALAPVSAGLLLVSATGAFADNCPASRTQQSAQNIQQSQRNTPIGSYSTNAAGQQEWHGQEGDWKGDWRLDGNGNWQGQWTPVKADQTPSTSVTHASNQREWHGRQGDWQGDWRLDDNGNWQGQWTPVKKTNSTPQGEQPRATPTTTKPQGGQPHATPSNTTVERILQLVNKERAAAGLHALTLNAQLSKAAQAHSDEMARTGLYSHTGPDGSSPGDRIQRSGYRWSMWAENIHHRTGSPETIMADWMHSPGHRANILNPNLREIGIGIDSGGTYWTQDFGTNG